MMVQYINTKFGWKSFSGTESIQTFTKNAKLYFGFDQLQEALQFRKKRVIFWRFEPSVEQDHPKFWHDILVMMQNCRDKFDSEAAEVQTVPTICPQTSLDDGGVS